MDARDESPQLYALAREDFCGDGPSRHAADGFPGGTAPPTPRIAQTVLGLIGVVRVRGAEFVLHLIVRGRTGVRVADEQCDGRAGGAAFMDAGEDLDRVRFLPRRHDIALPRTPAVELDLYFRRGDGQVRGAAINYHANARPVAFAPGGDGKKFAEAIGHRDGRTLGAPSDRASDKSMARRWTLSAKTRRR